MSSLDPKTRATIGAAAFVAMACLLVDATQISGMATRCLSRVTRSIQAQIQSSNLAAMEKRLEKDRKVTAVAIAEREQLLKHIEELKGLRDDLSIRRQQASEHLRLISNSLEASPTLEVVLVDGRAFRSCDLRARVSELKALEMSINHELLQTERVMSWLSFGLEEFDQKIAEIEERLRLKERDIQRCRSQMEGEQARSRLLDHLQEFSDVVDIR